MPQEANFKQFLARPENRKLIEKRQEVQRTLQLQKQAAAFRDCPMY
jgi:hypothetical protein